MFAGMFDGRGTWKMGQGDSEREKEEQQRNTYRMTTRHELVRQAIYFQKPARIPLWFVNSDQTDGDVMVYHLSLHREDGSHEWGYRLQSLDDGTMGYPTTLSLPDWDSFASFAPPPLREEYRMRRMPEFAAQSEDRYLLASLDLSGFTVYTLLRGFENAMQDFLLEPERFAALMDQIIGFENGLMTLAARHGFHGIHFADDWASQTGLMISPKLWRKLFKERYRRQFEHAHWLGLQTWFHCCGNFGAIIDDFHEIGVDVLNIAQPNVVDTGSVGRRLRGRQCFLMPISYQTVSISGTVQDIYDEAKRLFDELAAESGGFIGYVEEYGCMGMSPENYKACADAFRKLDSTLP